LQFAAGNLELALSTFTAVHGGTAMRVALLSHNAQSGDAIGNQLAEKLAFFLERGCEVRVFVETVQRLNPAIRPHACWVPEPAAAGEAWEFLALADLVIAEFGQAYSLLGLLPLLAKGKPRIVVDYHGITPPKYWGGHNREGIERGRQQCGLVWCADRAIVHSEFMSGELQEHTRFPANWIHRLAHPADIGRFHPRPPHQDLRQTLGIGDASIILFVGRVAPNKRVPVLIESLAHLNDLPRPVHLAVVGDSSDVYQQETRRCIQLAEELDLGKRVHFLGQLSDEQLLNAYRSADVFVMPSVHEGFCLPVVEAMACGVPVIAARASALPETVGNAGLTFEPDNWVDLANQVRRVLRGGAKGQKPEDRGQRTEDRGRQLLTTHHSPLTTHHPLRVAVVAFRYGEDVVGGAERSLRTMAEVLKQTGHHVEVFTTCTRSEREWTDEVAEGTINVDGTLVHRFRIDSHDRDRHYDVVRKILENDGKVNEEVEQEYLTHTIHSTRLMQALDRQIDQLDAVIVGPYLYGHTYDVVKAFPAKTILVPCFHDEPFARLRIWRPIYEQAAGIWYHSPEEQRFAEVELGLNHPYAECVGTAIDFEPFGNADRGRAAVGGNQRYVVYCGRYSRQKNLPVLIDYARRYHDRNPDRFTFAFAGQGEVPIPKEEWTRNLGFVDESLKRDVFAGAAAVVQLSQLESLSLVALEAWAQGTPTIAHERCAVLAGQIDRSEGGRFVDSFESFAGALDDLWQNPKRWQAMGLRGRDYVRSNYVNRTAFAETLVSAIGALQTPLRERMRERGMAKAAELDRSRWQLRFGKIIEDLLHAPRRPRRRKVVIEPRSRERVVMPGAGSILVPVRIENQGTHALAHEGPSRALVRAEVVCKNGRSCGVLPLTTELPKVLLPESALSLAVRVPVPTMPGTFRVVIHGMEFGDDKPIAADPLDNGETGFGSTDALNLIVSDTPNTQTNNICSPLLESIHAAIAEADRIRQLPDDYLDVTEGFMAKWKRRLKRKLLGNFKHAYVDVLSRQQSAFNRGILHAVNEIAECLSVLDHAGRSHSDASASDDPAFFTAQIQQAVESGRADELAMLFRDLSLKLAEIQEAHRRLDERLRGLESRLNAARLDDPSRA
jgi:glycosyltransferase involved in cell wall biosynthesis